MAKHSQSLIEKFDLGVRRQLLTGAQAIVRLVLMQKARDQAAGLNTAGYVTGYRGSPIAGLEGAFEGVRTLTAKNEIVFQPALNEDLAATAIWGAQQAELRGEGKYDGVFSVWYGKGPGVDRSGDAFRHANHAGTSRHGGVLALLGDDHVCESSTCAHQSEFAMMDCMIPVLNPAGVQEILDYGLYAFALSRYAGVWVSMKCVKDNIESTASVDGAVDRVKVQLPDRHDFAILPGELNIRVGDNPLEKERRLHEQKLLAVTAFARANNLDRTIMSGGANPKVGIITTGKSYLDTRAALDALGIDEIKANEVGLRLFKVAVAWPLEPRGARQFAKGLDLIIVVEEKRALIETQLKELLYNLPNRPLVVGKNELGEAGSRELFPAYGALDPTQIAIIVGEQLVSRGLRAETVRVRLERLKHLFATKLSGPDLITRSPYFCAGCPHNTSTKVPEGSRAYAGIGCHYMAQWMDRSTDGFTQMGGEGANWIGEAPFSKRPHVFQNMGDGTYTHSGSLAIRAAMAAKRNITFKLLFNDAVAMTGGQALAGGLTALQMAQQVLAEGVEHCALVTDAPEKYRNSTVPRGVAVYHRRDLMKVQKELAAIPGVSALVYDQTCASEKRRRRKRGLLPDPADRIFINPTVCEGCGDCGVKSNCVAVLPLETELGRKRQIDQSSCNKDFSCVEGFCPSFVTLTGATPRKMTRAQSSDPTRDVPIWTGLPDPTLPNLSRRPYAMIVDGVGGTGVVTVSAILGQAAHIAGLGFGAIDMTGMAQKGGSVACHIQVAESTEAIHSIRVGVGGADLVIGGDMIVTGSTKMLETIDPERTSVVCSNYELVTGDFTRNPDLTVPSHRLMALIASRLKQGALHTLDAHDYATSLFGDSIASNTLLLGYAYQLGLVPIPATAIEEAIGLNGASVTMNTEAFRLGRLAVHDRQSFDKIARRDVKEARPAERTLADILAPRAKHLAAYQSPTLAKLYRDRVMQIAKLETERAPGLTGLATAVGESYHKVLGYKDEYEVARLFTDGAFELAIKDNFAGVQGMKFHLAPPFLASVYKDTSTGRPRKVAIPAWLALPVFRLLAKAKRLRGTPWDPFGRTAERRLERQIIADYEAALDEIEGGLTVATHATAVALALQPLSVKGFGHVKLANLEHLKEARQKLLTEFRTIALPVPIASKRLLPAEIV